MRYEDTTTRELMRGILDTDQALIRAQDTLNALSRPGTFPQGHAAKRSRWLKYLPARAFDNSVYVVAVNQVGNSGPLEYPGNSIVFNPSGEIMAEAKSMVEDLLVLDLTAAGLQAKRREALQFFTQFRRPELYAELLRPSRAEID